ncbi:hypothetical protein RISK_003524 [Rhodopirellula islandica]|uniref:Uncharacterized protein n=1 Tax=Rhodopirellula islandica TaxID=595434 RepID=A0A0J1BCZ4_RHOIS|nr:hypothetical protein RISK_003524 [Rhodopirellula islandica]
MFSPHIGLYLDQQSPVRFGVKPDGLRCESLGMCFQAHN